MPSLTARGPPHLVHIPPVPGRGQGWVILLHFIEGETGAQRGTGLAQSPPCKLCSDPNPDLPVQWGSGLSPPRLLSSTGALRAGEQGRPGGGGGPPLPPSCASGLQKERVKSPTSHDTGAGRREGGDPSGRCACRQAAGTWGQPALPGSPQAGATPVGLANGHHVLTVATYFHFQGSLGRRAWVPGKG